MDNQKQEDAFRSTVGMRVVTVSAFAVLLTGAVPMAYAGPGAVPTGAAGGYTSIDPNVVSNNGLGVWNQSATRPTFYANSPLGMRIDPVSGLQVDTGTPMRKFVDALPGLTAAGANNLGQYLPIAVPDTTSYPGSDYYEMAVVEYAEKVHSDLPKATTFRGYVQIDRTLTNTSTLSSAGAAQYNALVAGLSGQQNQYSLALAQLNAYNAYGNGLMGAQGDATSGYTLAFNNYTSILAALAAAQGNATSGYTLAFNNYAAVLSALAVAQGNATSGYTLAYNNYSASHAVVLTALALVQGNASTGYTLAFNNYTAIMSALAVAQGNATSGYTQAFNNYAASQAIYQANANGLTTAQGNATSGYTQAFNTYTANLTALAVAQGNATSGYTQAFNNYVASQAIYQVNANGLNAAQGNATSGYTQAFNAYTASLAALAAAQSSYNTGWAYIDSTCVSVPTVCSLLPNPTPPPGYVDTGVAAGGVPSRTLVPSTGMPILTVPTGYVDSGIAAGGAPSGLLAVAGPVPTLTAPTGYVDTGVAAGGAPSGTLVPGGGMPKLVVPGGYLDTGLVAGGAPSGILVLGPAPTLAAPTGYVDIGVAAGGVPSGMLEPSAGMPTLAVPAGYVDIGMAAGGAPSGTLAPSAGMPTLAVPTGYVDTGVAAGGVPSGTLAPSAGMPTLAVPTGYVDTGAAAGGVPSGTLAPSAGMPTLAVPSGYVDTGIAGGGAPSGILAVAGLAPTVSVPTGYVDTGVAAGSAPSGTLIVDPALSPGGVGTMSPQSNGIALFYPDGTSILVAREDASHNIVYVPGINPPIPVMVQAYAYDKPHYLGPVIVATGESSPGLGDNRPLRMKFNNLLPLGRASRDPVTAAITRHGDLFLPFDTTLIGGGATPVAGEMYMQNRVSLHLHGGVTPWISDGTPHQWTVPVGETAASASLMTGVSFQDVPDMPDPGQGAETLYWTNAQSARLMFWHDHAVAQTRLNVYAGMAAGYVLTDAVEQAMINGGTAGSASFAAGTLPGIGIPLVIEDKTFVPRDIAQQDAKWRTDAWGQYGDLWYPHVIETNQDPNSAATSFTNPVGRWDYALWFWPVFPVTNALPTGDYGNVTTTPEGFMDTPTVDGTAYPTLTVNPEPTRFRFLDAANDRMLNLQLYVAVDANGALCDGTAAAVPGASGVACTEVRTVNAIASIGLPDCQISADGYDQLVLPLAPVTPPPPGSALPASGPGSCWPVNWPTDGRVGGVPDPSTVGPTIWHIGSEGGFLPAVASEPPVPVNFDYNRRSVTVLNVSQNNDPTQACAAANAGAGSCHGLYIGPAERADVVVDFSAYAGRTLILYNDAPAPNPGYDPRIDYYTGDPDNTLNGAAPSTQAGYGPNIRTIMQIKVGATATAKTNLTPAAQAAYVAGLNAALKNAYAASQDKPIVAGSAYDAAFGTTVTPTSGDQYARIAFGSNGELAGQFVDGNGVTRTYCVPDVIAATGTGFPTNMATLSVPAARTFNVSNPLGGVSAVTAPCDGPILNKTIQELFDKYGRMNATLGTEIPATTAITQTTLPFGYIDPGTETLPQGETQMWKITHNGVDAHPVHFHLLNVQLINRVGWDGTLKAPEAGEMGWKETIKMNPLEDVIVAVRARIPPLPGFGLPKSTRALDPSQPVGGTTDFMNIDPYTGVAPTGGVNNQLQDFDWEYVWHCHILGHEENDFMRPFVYTGLSVAPTSATQAVVAAASLSGATAVAALAAGTPGLPTFVLTGAGTPAAPYAMKISWADNSSNELGFRVERQLVGGVPVPLGTVRSYPTTLAGFTPRVNTLANVTSMIDNDIAAAVAADAPTLGTPTVLPGITATQPFASRPLGAAAPAYSVTVTWATVANAGRYIVLRAPGLGASTGFAPLAAAAGSVVVSGTAATFTDVSVLPNQPYTYQVQAVAANGDYTYIIQAVSATADSAAATGMYSFLVPNTNSTNTASAMTAPLLAAVAPVAAQALGTTANGNTVLGGVSLSFTNASFGETGYQVQVCNGQPTATVCSAGAALGAQGWTAVPAGNVSFTPAVLPNAGTGAMIATVTYNASYNLPNGGDNARLSFRVVPMVGAVAGPLGTVSNLIDLSQAPALPANFATTAGAPGSGAVTLTWTDVQSAVSYWLRVRSAATVAAVAAAPWSNVSTAIGGNVATYAYTGSTGLFYQFELSAQNPNGSSAYVQGPAIGL